MATGGGPLGRVTHEELALVLRRAAQLESSTAAERQTGSVTDRFEVEAIVAAAEEVGLSPATVQQALAELRTGALPEIQPVTARRHRLVGSRSVQETRLVAAPPQKVHAVTEDFLRRNNFELRRRHGNWATYRARYDPIAFGRWLLNVDGARRFTGVHTVHLTAEPVGGQGGSSVRIEATLRRGLTPVVVASSGSGVMLAGMSGVVAIVVGEPAVLLAGTAAGTGMAAGGLGLRRRWRRWRGREVGEVLAALLDRFDS